MWLGSMRAAIAAGSGSRGGGSPAAGQLDAQDDEDPGAARIDLLRALEELKSVASALQASLAVDLEQAERDRQMHAGVPSRHRGRGVASQLGLARRESPHRAASLLGAAKIWLSEMPCTFDALSGGRLSEHRAMTLVQETACLDAADRREVDRLMCADPGTLEGIGTRQLVAIARRHAARLDPAAVVKRARRAEGERCVTLRPAPDTMTYLTALLPMAQGVAALAALQRAADAATAAEGGDPRSRGQLMADTLVERVTGQEHAADVPVTVNLVMSDAALLAGGHEPAVVEGGGTAGGVVPAEVARALVAQGIDIGAAWLRRLYADPTGLLVAMSSRGRFHPEQLAQFLRLRDQGICRTPWCGAPIRQIDHVESAVRNGATSAENGQGLCVACNLAKEAPGWSAGTVDSERLRTGPPERAWTKPDDPPPRHAVATRTPTGHTYLSRAPEAPTPAFLPRLDPAVHDPGSWSTVEAMFGDLTTRWSDAA